MRANRRLMTVYAGLLIAIVSSASLLADTVDIQQSFSADPVEMIVIREDRSGFGIILRNDVETEIRFSHAAVSDIQVSLQGSVDSPRRFRGSRLEVSESRGELNLEIQLGVGFALFLRQTGRLMLDVQVPLSWRGDLRVETSSGTVSVTDGEFRDLDVDVSSGSIALGRVSARNVAVDSYSGNTNIQGVRAETFELDSSSGEVVIDTLFANTSRLSSSSGGIRIQNASGLVEADLSSGQFEIGFDGRRGRVVIDSSSGRIGVSNIDGSVDIDSSSGSISVSFASLADDSFIEASSGDIRIRLAPGFDANVDLESSSGGVRVDIPVVQGNADKDSFTGEFGRGGPVLRVRASSGSIIVSE